MNHGNPQSLQYVANAAFLASLYVDYLNASSIPGWFCGPNFITLETLRSFAESQVCCCSSQAGVFCVFKNGSQIGIGSVFLN